MEQTLKIINLMQEEKLFATYAIGGGIAALFYIEPITTFDLDIFIILPESAGILFIPGLRRKDIPRNMNKWSSKEFPFNSFQFITRLSRMR